MKFELTTKNKHTMKKFITNALLVMGFAVLSITTASAQKSKKALEPTKPPVSVIVSGIVHLEDGFCPTLIKADNGKTLVPLNLGSEHLVEGKVITFSYKVEANQTFKCTYDETVTLSTVKAKVTELIQKRK